MEAVHHAEPQRRFRADNGEADFVLLRETQQAVHVLGGDGDVFAFGLARAAGVAGRDEDLSGFGRLRDFPRQCVLATAAADDQDFQLHLSFSAK